MNNRFNATRFAPSPTGPLHFGSLVCAVSSFIIARQFGAQWLLRIEDIDRQRCFRHYALNIIEVLHAHGLFEDRTVTFQTDRDDIYIHYLNRLHQLNLVYGCKCTRKIWKARADIYDGHCRSANLGLNEHIVRFRNDQCPHAFEDLHMGLCESTMSIMQEDPILRRADGQFNYNLAVIADDIEQGIDLIIRGADLLEHTPLHQQMFKLLDYSIPAFLHIPLAVHAPGIKYAKQSFSPTIATTSPLANLRACLAFLGIDVQQLPRFTTPKQLLDWTINHWDLSRLSKSKEIEVTQTNDVYLSYQSTIGLT